MKRSDLISHFDYMRDFTLFDEEVCRELHLKRKLPNHYDVSKDQRVKSLFQPYNKNAVDEIMDYAAYAIAVNLAQLNIQKPSHEQLQEILKLCGWTNAQMEAYVKEQSDMRPEAVSNQSLVPITFILSRVINEAILSLARRYDTTPEPVRKLQQLIEHMESQQLFTFFDHGSTEEYEEFVCEHFSYYVMLFGTKVECTAFEDAITAEAEKNARSGSAMVENMLRQQQSTPSVLLQQQKKQPLSKLPEVSKLGQGDLAHIDRIMPQFIDNSGTFSGAPTVVNSALAKIRERAMLLDDLNNRFFTKYNEIRNDAEASWKESFANAYLPSIAESALCAIMAEDEVIGLKGSSFVWMDYIRQCEFPNPLIPYPDLKDEDEWSYYTPECNGNLALPIIEESDMLSYGISDTVTLPIKTSSIIAKLADEDFQAPLYIRKSHIEFFKSLGCSAQKARDYAVVIAMLAYTGQKDFEAKPSSYYPEYSTKDENIAAALEEETQRRISADRDKQRIEREAQLCRHELSSLQRKYDKLQQELDKAKTEIQKLEELLELHEEMQQDNPDDDLTPDDTIFPYHTSSKIVLYGGFASFHKELLKLIPSIRIIEHSAHPSFESVRNADMLFLQINRTSHSNYWAAVDTAKNADVPIYHLNYAGPMRCAKFIIEQIEKMKR